MRKTCALAPFVLLAVLSGCGGSDSPTRPTNPPVTAPPAPITSVLYQGVFTELPPVSEGQMAWIVQFANPAAGTLDVSVDWTFATNDLDLSLFQGTLDAVAAACPSGVFCEEQVATAFTLAKPEKLTFPDAPAGPYVLQVANLGSTPEAGTIEILLTRQASAASFRSGSQTAASEAASGMGPALGSR